MNNREQFEVWYLDAWGCTEDNLDSLFEESPHGNEYYRFGVRLAWQAWQEASKASEQQLAALVEALEKSQQPAEPFGFTDGDAHGMVYEPRHADRLANPCPVYRLPPLESKSRTVTVKLPSLKQPEYCERHMWSNGVFNYRSDAIGILRAAGIQVIEEEG